MDKKYGVLFFSRFYRLSVTCLTLAVVTVTPLHLLHHLVVHYFTRTARHARCLLRTGVVGSGCERVRVLWVCVGWCCGGGHCGWR